eukprot:TRINITY_DN21378_c0_g1_i1.p1 TRINITY_DN21378_c0_g1~~TRINITY_DN21378_c0_g1_i1.p1  ORF type:complete len:367 (+),score=61.27 TRINITY_DN21378_c0_g1_i1:22-1101(+)
MEVKKVEAAKGLRRRLRNGCTREDILYKAISEGDGATVLALSELLETEFLTPSAYNLTFNPALLALSHPFLLPLLHEAGFPLTTPDPLRGTPLMIAASTGNILAIQTFAELGVPLSDEDECHRTALTVAITSRQIESVEVLLSLGVDPNETTFYGPPMNIAAENNSCDIMRMLHRWGGDVNKKDVYGRTVLQRYVEGGGSDAEVVGLMVGMGVQVDNVSVLGKTALMKAVENSDPGLVEILIGFGASVNLRTSRGSPLTIAVQRPSLPTVQALTSAGADLTTLTPWGATLLDLSLSPLITTHLQTQGVPPKPIAAKLLPLLLLISLVNGSHAFYTKCAATLFIPSFVSFAAKVFEAWKY